MSIELNGFTVSCLLYGDHFDLARRCIGSISETLDSSLVRSLRIAMNAVCARTRNYVCDLVAATLPAHVEVLVYDNRDANRLKYPMLRKMLYDQQHPVLTPFFMWFDDDSCVAPEVDYTWWSEVHLAMQTADVIGKLYRMPLRGMQHLGIEAQPWFNDVYVSRGTKILFATGGWWAAHTSVLMDHDWPFKAIKHNGGDVMLGALCAQQRLRLKGFSHGVWINANREGRTSQATRRGFTGDAVWLQPGNYKKPDLSHHAFEIVPYDPRLNIW